MSSLEDVFEAACSAREIPGVVLLATNRTGSWDYNKAFGHRTALGTDELLEEDCTMWVASCTKLLTSIACMQCVERGLIGLDDDVRVLLRELQHIDIVKRDSAGQGFSSTKNIRPITLRHLLTHTSGFAYEFNEPLLQEWRRQQSAQEKRGSLATLRGRYLHPLLYEPGTSWSYGPSTDWAGLLVERLSGMSLQAYMAHNIWEPLSIKSMTFFLSTRPDMQSRAASMCQRKPDSPMVVIHAERQPTLEPDVEDCLGGGGIYAAPAEYVKVLRALLRDAGISNSTDYEAYDSATTPLPHQQRLLRRSTAESMFEPQLNEPGRKALQARGSISC
ncbi:beta-lactamase/transpeptidase-like protein [Xylaria arbuscula]|nr:beta-lactamase/transpeptidase-like protein [Xylaria arbuscula]